jgi:hypothetical protein
MKRRTRKDLTIAITMALAVLGLLIMAGGAEAATLHLKCSGKGEQVPAQEYNSVQCGVEAGKTRNIEGVLRNDKNKPVAGTLNVTFSHWVSAGNGAYDITPYKTVEVKSSANGKFTIPKVTTATEETIFIEAVGDAESELSTIAQEVNLQRLVTLRGKKLGGGKVQVTVKGLSAPAKVALELEGYPVSGGSGRKPNKAGVAIFNLHGERGTFGIYLEAGELTDLYYVDSEPVKL